MMASDHYGNNPMKCVNVKLYLFIKVIIEFSNLIVIVNQQGTPENCPCES